MRGDVIIRNQEYEQRGPQSQHPPPIESWQQNRSSCGKLVPQQGGDQEPTEDEEQVYSYHSSQSNGHSAVERHHDQHGNGSNSIQGGIIFHIRLLKYSYIGSCVIVAPID